MIRTQTSKVVPKELLEVLKVGAEVFIKPDFVALPAEQRNDIQMWMFQIWKETVNPVHCSDAMTEYEYGGDHEVTIQ